MSQELKKWIDANYLEDQAIKEINIQFAQSPLKVLHLPNFLKPEVANRLGQFLTQEAQYKTIYALYSAKGHVVSGEEWLTAPDKDRMYSFDYFDGASPQHRLSSNLITFMRFRKTLIEPVFRNYATQLTGLPLTGITSINIHNIKRGHYLRPHNDRGEHKRIAFIFYLTPDWREDYGGHLHVVDNHGQEHLFAPSFNSLLLFDVAQHDKHFVGRINDSIGDKGRITIGGWLTDGDR